MEHYEMAELLSKKTGMSLEEARGILEENEWDILDAMVMLERKRAAEEKAASDARPEPSDSVRQTAVTPSEQASGKKESFFTNGFAQIWYYITRVIRIMVENYFVLYHKEKRILAFPVLILLALLVFAFWFTLAVLVIGLFVGCRYRLEGKELGSEAANQCMDKVGDAVDSLKAKITKDSGDRS